MKTDVRADPATVDPAWLSEALDEAGVADGGTVTEVELSGFIGTGQMSRNARFRLTWDREPAGRPVSLVGKFPSDDAAARAGAIQSGSYFHEYGFYRELAPTVEVRAPRCYVARFDPDSSDFVLMLEDMAGSEQGNQLTGCSPDEVDLGIEQAVALHAPRWGDPVLSGLVVLEPHGAAKAEQLDQFYGATFEPGLDRLAPGLDADVADLVRRFAPLVSRWSSGTETPKTIVHRDFRPDNFLFGRTPDAPPLCVVDWQTISVDVGALDVAYLIGGAFEPEQRAAVERDLVEGYRQRLESRGISYDSDACWRDYRWGTLWGLIIAVAATMMAEQTERGDAMLTAMIARHGRHALDLDALALLT